MHNNHKGLLKLQKLQKELTGINTSISDFIAYITSQKIGGGAGIVRLLPKHPEEFVFLQMLDPHMCILPSTREKIVFNEKGDPATIDVFATL